MTCKLQLTGRCLPFRPTVGKHWPEHLREIGTDALSIRNVNDLPGAYYHLRTAVEHHLKTTLNVDFAEHRKGDELCEKYNKAIPDELKKRTTSCRELYDKLSQGMHTRQTDPDELESLFAAFDKHLFFKHTLEQFPVD